MCEGDEQFDASFAEIYKHNQSQRGAYRLVGHICRRDVGSVGPWNGRNRHVLHRIHRLYHHVHNNAAAHRAPTHVKIPPIRMTQSESVRVGPVVCIGAASTAARRTEAHGVVDRVHARHSNLARADVQQHGEITHKGLRGRPLIGSGVGEKLVHRHGKHRRHEEQPIVNHQPELWPCDAAPTVPAAATHLDDELPRLRVHQIGTARVAVGRRRSHARGDARNL